jgi:hypothetical protein
MFQYARILDDQGLEEAAGDGYRAYIAAFPNAANLAKAQARRAAL